MATGSETYGPGGEAFWHFRGMLSSAGKGCGMATLFAAEAPNQAVVPVVRAEALQGVCGSQTDGDQIRAGLVVSGKDSLGADR